MEESNADGIEVIEVGIDSWRSIRLLRLLPTRKLAWTIVENFAMATVDRKIKGLNYEVVIDMNRVP